MSFPARDVSRKNWDLAAFEKRAKDRRRAEKEAEAEKLRAHKAAREASHIDDDPFAPTRAWLTKRDHDIDLESKVGTVEVVPSVQKSGFYCKLCDTTMKDSNRYLQHVNSRFHQKALGMSMRVRRSTAQEIRNAFDEEVRKRAAQGTKARNGPLTLKRRIIARKAEEKKKRSTEGDAGES
ncbi:Zinc finger matrin-type protein 2 [Gracilariopsis chorda]|uniref:Zinc finger matrin-type protein 2 n=1 Tax=Gracilariopsis chorda TaxID=448386 RepID=A0A2V3J357_9FLOR|nr:Zinc finger matrin-type protein 2 [Gracilariopsis chorda]|eukprot:PXF47820.1 Zinc finger matrin-type protein 2 [Gracilariopsis chorda]